MSLRLSTLLRSAARAHTRSSFSRCLATAAAQTPSSEASPPPPQSAPVSRPNPKIDQLVDDISGLTLLQAADLVSLLKSRLNIQEIAMPAAAAAAPAAGASAPTEAVEQEKPKEKTIFNIKLESFEPSSKPKIIKEIKAMISNLTLIEAKKFVESVPKVVKENVPKEEAEKLKATFEALGAVVTME